MERQLPRNCEERGGTFTKALLDLYSADLDTAHEAGMCAGIAGTVWHVRENRDVLLWGAEGLLTVFASRNDGESTERRSLRMLCRGLAVVLQSLASGVDEVPGEEAAIERGYHAAVCYVGAQKLGLVNGAPSPQEEEWAGFEEDARLGADIVAAIFGEEPDDA